MIETPHNVEAEKALIGHVIQDVNSYDKVADVVFGEWVFYNSKHRKIWKAITKRILEGESVDPISVSEDMGMKDALYFFDAIESSRKISPTASAKILVEKWLQRQALHLSGVIQSSVKEHEDVFDLLDTIHGKIYKMERALEVGVSLDIGTYAEQALDRIIAVRERGDGLLGVSTGFDELDRLTAGLERGKLFILAGRPSMGKTAFALDIAKKTAMRGNGVGFFSLEMGAGQLAQRLIASTGKIDGQKARTGRISDKELELAQNAVKKIKELNIHVDDAASLTPMKLRAVARRWIREKKVNLIIIDYMQLMKGEGSYNQREEEMASISKSLKEIAKDLSVPILALAQLNRATEHRADKTPRLSDLRESGQIEQDADLVAFVHRPEYYGIEITEDGASTENVAEIIIGKQRDGPLGVVKYLFLKEQGSFASYHAVDTESNTDSPDDEPPW